MVYKAVLYLLNKDRIYIHTLFIQSSFLHESNVLSLFLNTKRNLYKLVDDNQVGLSQAADLTIHCRAPSFKLSVYIFSTSLITLTGHYTHR